MNKVNNNNNINVAVGKNFSGRSDYLKNECNNYAKGIYIGEIPANYISGVSPTVKSELDLFSSKTNPDTLSAINNLISNLNFNSLYESNPFLLSGGEQALLTILSGILAEPNLLAIDTAVEQLGKEWKGPLLNLIQGKLAHQFFLLSDNRIKEYGIPYIDIHVNQINKEFEYSFAVPSLINFSNETSSEAVSINDLWFSYKKGNPILKRIDVNFKPGNIYFLRGKNGAGKSTFAKILSGILKTKKGSIRINNKLYNPFKIPGNLFGYSFQNPDEQLFSRTVANEVLNSIRDENSGYIERREVFLKMFGLENLRDLHPAELPFVMRKRIALAATLAYDRSWYIIDEPTIGQDDSFVGFLVSLFEYLSSIGKGLIIISHSQAFIDKFHAKILYLENGYLKTN